MAKPSIKDTMKINNFMDSHRSEISDTIFRQAKDTTHRSEITGGRSNIARFNFGSAGISKIRPESRPMRGDVENILPQGISGENGESVSTEMVSAPELNRILDPAILTLPVVGVETNALAPASGYHRTVRMVEADSYTVGSLPVRSEPISLGNHINITDRILGHGAYGKIYLATDEHGHQIAVKCCDIERNGIPNLMEANIMASMTHPYLNRALRINASDEKLYILQDLARCDLAQYTRRDKGNHRPSIEELRRWCFCLAHAVSALHMEGIIHADIKASNVLLYEDGSVRLTDYGLAIKKWRPTDTFNFNVCTCTHRPLECLVRREWNEALDIWSLGCTFYEIAYRELLFPYQGVLEPMPKKSTHLPMPKASKLPVVDGEASRIREREIKIRLRNRSINAILDWMKRGPNAGTSKSSFQEIVPFELEYMHFQLCEDYNRPEMAVFNDLIGRMLMVDPTHRPSIGALLSHPFFHSMKAPLYLTISRPASSISVSEQARVTQYISRYTRNSDVQAMAIGIYRRCSELDHMTEQMRAAVATWIASKIIHGTIPEAMEPFRHKLLPAEREVCHTVSFRLHG